MSLTTQLPNPLTSSLSMVNINMLPGSARIGLHRKKSASLLEKSELPDTKNEEFRHTPIKRELEKTFDFSVPSVQSFEINDISEYKIPGLEADYIVFVNGLYTDHLSTISAKSFQVMSLSEASMTHSDKVDIHLGKYATRDTDMLTVWNTALWSEGTFIRVPDNTHVQKPVVILQIFDSRTGQVKVFNRNLVLIGKNSSVDVIVKNDTLGDQPVFSNTVTEFSISEAGSISLTELQTYSPTHHHYGHTRIYQQDKSQVQCHTITLDGALVRNTLGLIIDGEHCESHLHGLYLLNKETLADNHTIVDHKKPNSYSNEFYRGVLDGHSHGVFNGKIYVRPDAQKTNAFQSNRNILLSDLATVNTKPQLEIWADDVKCSHGCTTGQLDEDALFYLRSRGLPKEKATEMLLHAFVSETFLNIKNQALREFVDKIVRAKLSNGSV